MHWKILKILTRFLCFSFFIYIINIFFFKEHHLPPLTWQPKCLKVYNVTSILVESVFVLKFTLWKFDCLKFKTLVFAKYYVVNMSFRSASIFPLANQNLNSGNLNFHYLLGKENCQSDNFRCHLFNKNKKKKIDKSKRKM